MRTLLLFLLLATFGTANAQYNIFKQGTTVYINNSVVDTLIVNGDSLCLVGGNCVYLPIPEMPDGLWMVDENIYLPIDTTANFRFSINDFLLLNDSVTTPDGSVQFTGSATTDSIYVGILNAGENLVLAGKLGNNGVHGLLIQPNLITLNSIDTTFLSSTNQVNVSSGSTINVSSGSTINVLSGSILNIGSDTSLIISSGDSVQIGARKTKILANDTTYIASNADLFITGGDNNISMVGDTMVILADSFIRIFATLVDVVSSMYLDAAYFEANVNGYEVNASGSIAFNAQSQTSLQGKKLFTAFSDSIYLQTDEFYILSDSVFRLSPDNSASIVGQILMYSDTINSMVKVSPTLTGTATPIGSITPAFIGQIFIRTDNDNVFISKGLTDTDWILVN